MLYFITIGPNHLKLIQDHEIWVILAHQTLVQDLTDEQKIRLATVYRSVDLIWFSPECWYPMFSTTTFLVLFLKKTLFSPQGTTQWAREPVTSSLVPLPGRLIDSDMYFLHLWWSLSIEKYFDTVLVCRPLFYGRKE